MTPPGPGANPSRAGVFVRHPGLMPSALKFSGEDKDLTLDELAQFVEDARRAKVPGGNPIRAEVSTSGKIKGVEVALEEDDN